MQKKLPKSQLRDSQPQNGDQPSSKVEEKMRLLAPFLITDMGCYCLGYTKLLMELTWNLLHVTHADINKKLS